MIDNILTNAQLKKSNDENEAYWLRKVAYSRRRNRYNNNGSAPVNTPSPAPAPVPSVLTFEDIPDGSYMNPNPSISKNDWIVSGKVGTTGGVNEPPGISILEGYTGSKAVHVEAGWIIIKRDTVVDILNIDYGRGNANNVSVEIKPLDQFHVELPGVIVIYDAENPRTTDLTLYGDTFKNIYGLKIEFAGTSADGFTEPVRLSNAGGTVTAHGFDVLTKVTYVK